MTLLMDMLCTVVSALAMAALSHMGVTFDGDAARRPAAVVHRVDSALGPRPAVFPTRPAIRRQAG